MFQISYENINMHSVLLLYMSHEQVTTIHLICIGKVFTAVPNYSLRTNSELFVADLNQPTQTSLLMKNITKLNFVEK